jgi:hypothetical protein
MDEFIGRMATQRHVLNVINRKISSTEKLFGLSANAIERWALVNRIEPTAEVVRLLRRISSELFFMATRSQEPVTREYELRSKQIVESVSALENAV